MFKVMPHGDGAIHVQFGKEICYSVFEMIQSFCAEVTKVRDDRIIELIPTYTSVTIFYNPETSYEEMAEWLFQLQGSGNAGTSNPSGYRVVEIPVCYGGEFGPDLDYVANYHGLTVSEVIHRHTAPEYLVYMIGFMPGFPYLGGLAPELATPRLSRPRSLVPRGSVGIAGGQTGLYPLDSPGGWQLIGRTPLVMFDAQADPPTLLRSGDKVRFVPITKEEYLKLEEKNQ